MKIRNTKKKRECEVKNPNSNSNSKFCDVFWIVYCVSESGELLLFGIVYCEFYAGYEEEEEEEERV